MWIQRHLRGGGSALGVCFPSWILRMDVHIPHRSNATVYLPEKNYLLDFNVFVRFLNGISVAPPCVLFLMGPDVLKKYHRSKLFLIDCLTGVNGRPENAFGAVHETSTGVCRQRLQVAWRCHVLLCLSWTHGPGYLVSRSNFSGQKEDPS